MHRFPRAVTLIATIVLAASALAYSAAARPFRVDRFHDFAAGSPFRGNCGVAGTYAKDSEVEPSIAVNPLNRRNVVIAWIQDRFNGPGGLGIVVAATTDGGRTWNRLVVPGVSKCSGGTHSRVSDPWLSFGPDGVLYLATVPLEPGELLLAESAVAVNVSHDGGLHWSDPVLVEPQDEFFNDKETIAADPFSAGKAYVAYSRRFLGGSVSYFARSDDSGKTWSVPSPMYESVDGTEAVGHLLLVPTPEVLVSVFVSWPLDGPVTIMSIRSTDGGQTWSQPVPIGSGAQTHPSDPDDGDTVRSPPFPTAAVNSRGTLFVAWRDITSTISSRILLSKSRDEGQSWNTARTVVEVPTQAFMPTLATARRGTVGVYYYDFRNDQRGDGELTTDVWFRHSHDGGKTWKENHMAGPFDVRTAPTSGSGYFVGDYMGLATAGRAFYAAFGMSAPQAKRGRSDIFFEVLKHRRPRTRQERWA